MMARQHNTQSHAVMYWHGVLVFAVILSAFSVVYVKDLRRRIFINLQSQRVQYERTVVRHGQLLLEQSTLARQTRIARLVAKMGMHLPKASQIKLLQLSETPDDD
jgi:cell division protein FtsL